MRKSTKAAWLAVPLAGFLLLAACGDDSGSSSATTGGGGYDRWWRGGHHRRRRAATTGAAGGDATSLASVCPATVVVQTDWNPEAEHGGLYKLLGPNPSVDTDKKIVTGELTASGGVDTGVKIEIRVGRSCDRLPAGDRADVHRRLDLARLCQHRRGRCSTRLTSPRSR